MFERQPIVKDYKEIPMEDTGIDPRDRHFSPDDPIKGYLVTDRLQFVPGIGLAGTDLNYPALLQNSEDGIRSVAKAAAGVVIKSSWRVLQAENQLMLVEDSQAEAFVLLMPFIKYTMEKAHHELCNNLIEAARVVS